ncbi:MAG: glycosyltransferase [Bacteriovoracia bacterium]
MVVCVVPTFNRRAFLEKLVIAVQNQTLKPDLFIILDNASTDSTSEYLSQISYNQPIKIEVIRKEINLGASLGMKFLFEEALKRNANWIWVLDDDAIPKKDALELLVKNKEFENPDAYILESAIVDENDKWSEPNRPARFDKMNFSFQGLTLDEFHQAIKQDHAIEVNTGGYNGLLIRAETFKEFGYPRSEFYLWYDDVEFVLRVSQKKKVFLIPKSQIFHFAQGLVPHETKWPFRGPLAKIPTNLIPRYYYLHRNWLVFGRQYLPSNKYIPFFIKNLARNLAAPLLLKQDKLFYRWSIELKAALDAVTNRLGKRV